MTETSTKGQEWLQNLLCDAMPCRCAVKMGNAAANNTVVFALIIIVNLFRRML
jgi:hypothetical protein